MAMTWLLASPGAADDGETVPVAAPAAPGRAVVDATSGSTSVPFGTTDLMCATSAATVACGALTTIALPIGKPSELATAVETTASTPPMPTVPNPPTRSASIVRP